MKEVTVEKSSSWSKGLQHSDAETLEGWEQCRGRVPEAPAHVHAYTSQSLLTLLTSGFPT